MKSPLNLSLRRALVAAGALVILAGCSMQGWSPRAYEYRYRIFEAAEPLLSEMQPPISQDLLAQRFLPVGAINRSMDILTQDGFVLAEIERLPAGSNYYKFTFRRPQPGGPKRPTRAPVEYTGVYQVLSPGDQGTYYAFSPIFIGYTVVTFHGAELPRMMDAAWDGEQLVARDGDTEHIFMISSDGLSIQHIKERVHAGGLDRQVTSARRIQSGKP